MSRPARILLVINDIPYFLAHWIERAVAARDAGYDVHIVGTGHPAVTRLAEAGLPFHDVAFSRGRSTAASEFGSLTRITRLYRALKPDLVHHITIKPVIYGGLAARRLRLPAVVSTVPGLGYVFSREGAVAALQRAAIKQAYSLALAHRNSTVIFENPDDCADFVRWRLIRAGQGLVIKGAGVDLERFSPRPFPDGPPTVVLAGRLLWEKGVREFVEAARLVKSLHSSVRLALVGAGDAGSPASVPEEQLRAWAAAGDVEWWGPQADMPDVLARATIVCLPSFYREGIPRVLIEAAACGRPIVTTDMPGCREIARDGQNGLLVPPRDVPALATAILQLLASPETCTTMGQRGRAIAELGFGKEDVIRQTLAVYQARLQAAR